MKSSFIAITVLALASVTLGMSTAHADQMKCKSKGDFVRCALPNANHRHVSLHKETSRNKCEKGYSWVPTVTGSGLTIDVKGFLTIAVTRDITKTTRNGIVAMRAGQVIVRRISGVMNVPITGMVTKLVKMMAGQA